MLISQVCEELDKKVVVLLCCSPLAIVGCGVLELDAFKGCFYSWLIWVLGETRGVIDTPTRAHGGVSIHTVGGRWTWGESYTSGLFLGTFVAFGGVLDKFNGFAVSAVYNCCYGHGKTVDLGTRAIMLHEVHGSIWDGGREGVRAIE